MVSALGSTWGHSANPGSSPYVKVRKLATLIPSVTLILVATQPTLFTLIPVIGCRHLWGRGGHYSANHTSSPFPPFPPRPALPHPPPRQVRAQEEVRATHISREETKAPPNAPLRAFVECFQVGGGHSHSWGLALFVLFRIGETAAVRKAKPPLQEQGHRVGGGGVNDVAGLAPRSDPSSAPFPNPPRTS